jgi:hypothetical protein
MNPELLKKLREIASEALKKVPQVSRIDAPEYPALPPVPMPLSQEEQWASVIWMIDYAEKHGQAALEGLAIAYGNIIQADYFKIMLMDARQFSEGHSDISHMLWEPKAPLTDQGETLETLLMSVSQEESANFLESIVISAPWRRDRLIRSLDNLKNQDWRQDSNHNAEIWYPWPIIWVTNGYHSTAVGALYGKGALSVSLQYDATKLLHTVRPDGKNWLRTHDGSIIDSISSLPMAAIFEIGRRLVKA